MGSYLKAIILNPVVKVLNAAGVDEVAARAVLGDVQLELVAGMVFVLLRGEAGDTDEAGGDVALRVAAHASPHTPIPSTATPQLPTTPTSQSCEKGNQSKHAIEQHRFAAHPSTPVLSNIWAPFPQAFLSPHPLS